MSRAAGRPLVIESYDGTAIPNEEDLPPSNSALVRERRHRRLEIARSTQVGPPTGRYNCHGLVFVARRGVVPPAGQDLDIGSLLRRDHFENVEDPKPGDIAAYVNDSGEIDHTGFVVSITEFGAVMVWSMWGALGEFVHQHVITPYQDCRIEYWRLVR